MNRILGFIDMKKRAVSRLLPFFVLFYLLFSSVAEPVSASLLKNPYGQATGDTVVKFRYPLDVALSLSGDYGELRGNHFHGGIDFRVGGVVGAPIYATERGYVSKISVSPTGYGNALYITHPNGYVSVYGHLHKYADKLQKYLRECQYEEESFRIDLEFEPDEFPVAKGELVAYAGNTGSSGGPHLHFEIRDHKNVPLSVLERNYVKVTDNLAPAINRVDFYGYSQVYGAPKTFRVQRPQEQGAAINVPMYFYVAVDAVDKMEGTYAKLAVNEYKVYLDTALVYHLTIGEVPFSHSKYINSLIEYSRKRNGGKSMVKTYVEPGNLLDYKIDAVNNGILCLKDTLPHKVKIEVIDYKKNRSFRTYTVKRVDSLFTSQMGDKPEGTYMAWYLANIYERDGFKINIPSASLYRSIYFTLDSAASRVTPFAPVWQVHTGDIPLHTAASLQIKYEGPDSLSAKALIVSCGANGRLYGVGGKYENGVVKAKVSSFGNYTIGVDIMPPVITPNFKNGAVISGNVVSFIIKDALSGIKNYRVEIDGHWVLAEFDAKRSRLSVPLNEAKIKKGITHKLKISVVDNKDNEAVATRSFKW